jgi:hypothetical protein
MSFDGCQGEVMSYVSDSIDAAQARLIAGDPSCTDLVREVFANVRCLSPEQQVEDLGYFLRKTDFELKKVEACKKLINLAAEAVSGGNRQLAEKALSAVEVASLPSSAKPAAVMAFQRQKDRSRAMAATHGLQLSKLRISMRSAPSRPPIG